MYPADEPREHRIAVVILAWNVKPLLKRFLPDIVAHTSENAKVYVADNGSTDGTQKFVSTTFPSVSIVRNDSNLGFAKGYNEALMRIRAEYYVLLNSDAVTPPGWLQPLVAMIESDAKIAACQPKILSHGNPEYFDYAGAAGGLIDILGYPFCRGRMLERVEKDQGQYDDPCEIFWASGACLMLRADLFWQVGGFEEDFYLHMEEIDLCWRLRKLGYRIMYCPSSRVFHIGGWTVSRESAAKCYYNFRNNLILLAKHMKLPNLLLCLLGRHVLDAVACLNFLVHGQFGMSLSVLRGYASFYRALPRIARYRRHEAPSRPVSNRAGVFRGSMILNYVLGKWPKL